MNMLLTLNTKIFVNTRLVNTRLRMLVAFSCVLLSGMALAQRGGGIGGTIADSTGALVPGATIVVTKGRGSEISTTAGGDGAYSIGNLAPGIYRLAVSAKGFAPYSFEKLKIEANHFQKLDIQLKIAVAEQQVTVKADADDSSDGDGELLTGKQLETLPDDPDELKTALNMLASEAGGDGKAQIFVDGLPATSLPPLDSIAEVRIIQNLYSAKFSGVGTPRIEIRTKPGTEKLHGMFGLTGADSALNAKNPLVPNEPPYYSWGSEASLGGPITKSITYFADAGYRHAATNAIINAETLDSEFQPVEVQQGVAAGSTGSWFRPRVSWRSKRMQILSLEYDFQHQVSQDQGVGGFAMASQAVRAASVSQGVMATASETFGAHLLNETEFRLSLPTREQQAASTLPTITVSGAFTGGGSSAGRSSGRESMLNFRDNMSYNVGKHVISFGAEIDRNTSFSQSTAGFNGNFIFPSLTAYQVTEQDLAAGMSPEQIRSAGGGATQFSITSGEESTSAAITELGFYGEDSWRARPRLTINAGVRMERAIAQPGQLDFAPRLGFSYGMGGAKGHRPKTRIMGGYGWSYTPFSLPNLLQLARFNGTHLEQYLINQPDFYPTIPPISTLSSIPGLSPSLYRVSPDFQDAYTMTASMGVRRELTDSVYVSFNYELLHTLHQLVVRNINAPLPGSYDPADPTSGVRPLGTAQNIYEYDSGGVSKENSFTASIHVHRGNRVSLMGSFTHHDSHSDANSSPSNPYDLLTDYGPTGPSDTFSLMSQFALPFQVNVGSMFQAQSGNPYNIVLGYDANGDGQLNDRPSFATDLSRSSVVTTTLGTFDSQPIRGQKVIPFNYGVGPMQFTSSIFLSKSFAFGGGKHGTDTRSEGSSLIAAGDAVATTSTRSRSYRLQFSIAAQNPLNVSLPGDPVAVLESPLFGISNTARPGRSLSLRSKFSF